MAGFDQHLIDVFSGHDFTVDQERVDFIATVVAQFRIDVDLFLRGKVVD